MSVLNALSRAVAVLAALCMTATPMVASAQEATGSYSVTYVPPTTTMQLEEPAMGLALPSTEASRLVRDGCLVGPLSTTQGLYDWAKRKGVAPCSPDFYKKVDTFAGKESMVTFRVTRVADGYLNCNSAKSVNLGNNRMSCVLYPFNPAFNLQGQVGKYADVNWAEGGDSTKARVLTALGGALIAGPMTAATGALLQKQCKNCGDTFNIAGGQAVAASRSDANAASQIQFQGSFGGGTGTCSTCGGGSTGGGTGHTQDGPGSAPYNGGG
jgi:hypothetical protein